MANKTTTSEKILSEMERMGRMKIKDLCAQMHWQYQKFHRRLQANDFSPEDLALIATSMNTLQPYLPPHLRRFPHRRPAPPRYPRHQWNNVYQKE